jgi:hypothetical protein
METTSKKNSMFLAALSIGVIFLVSFASPTQLGLADALQNKTLMQAQGVQRTHGIQSTTGNTTKMNIILVHGAWADAASWSKVIPYVTLWKMYSSTSADYIIVRL